MDFAHVVSWRRWLEAQGLAAATIRLYSYGLFRLMTEFGDTPDNVASFLASLGTHAVARTQYHRGLRSFFRWALMRGVVDSDPTAELPKIKTPHRPKQVALTEDELTRYLLAAAWKDARRGRPLRRVWVLMLAFSLGARRMEISGITPEDVDYGERKVFLRNCKGGKTRWVEANEWALLAIGELQPWAGRTLAAIPESTITGWAKEAAVDAGLYPKVRGRVAHVLRATFISTLLDKGTPVQVVRDIVGHESIATTNIYAAVRVDSDRRAAVDRVPFAAG